MSRVVGPLLSGRRVRSDGLTDRSLADGPAARLFAVALGALALHVDLGAAGDGLRRRRRWRRDPHDFGRGRRGESRRQALDECDHRPHLGVAQMILRDHAGGGNTLNDRTGQIGIRRHLAGGRRAELEPTLREISRGSLEVMRGHALAVARGAVADRAIVAKDALAHREVGRLSRGARRQPEDRGDQGERPGTNRQRSYSRTTSWPTTCAGCSWHLIGKIPALSAVNFTFAVFSPATTSLTLNAAISNPCSSA